MSAVKCPKCGGSGQMSYNPFPSAGWNVPTGPFPQTTCNACNGIGVIKDPPAVINVYIHVHTDEKLGEFKGRLMKDIAEALAEQAGKPEEE